MAAGHSWFYASVRLQSPWKHILFYLAQTYYPTAQPSLDCGSLLPSACHCPRFLWHANAPRSAGQATNENEAALSRVAEPGIGCRLLGSEAMFQAYHLWRTSRRRDGTTEFNCWLGRCRLKQAFSLQGLGQQGTQGAALGYVERRRWRQERLRPTALCTLAQRNALGRMAKNFAGGKPASKLWWRTLCLKRRYTSHDNC